MKLINRLLNTSELAAPLTWDTADGASAGVSGEAPAAAATPAEAPKVGDTTNVEATPEPDAAGSMFAMPSDDTLFALEEDNEVVTPPAKTPAAAKETPAATPTATPAATPAAGTPQATPAAPPATPAVAAPASATPTPAQTPTPTAEQQPTGEVELPHQTFLKALDAGRDQLLPQLAAQYAVSDEDAEKLGIVDKSVLSGLAANLHYNVMRATTQMLLQTLGPAVTQIMENNTKVEGFIKKFYDANPELSRETDHNLVTQYANMYWKTNPQGTAADMIKQVGTMAKAHLGKLTAQVTPPAQTPTPGVQPVKVAPKRQQPSFTPAQAGGAAPAAKATPQAGDIWGNLSDQMLNADDD